MVLQHLKDIREDNDVRQTTLAEYLYKVFKDS